MKDRIDILKEITTEQVFILDKDEEHKELIKLIECLVERIELLEDKNKELEARVENLENSTKEKDPMCE